MKTRTEGLSQRMIAGQKGAYDSSSEPKLYAAVALAFPGRAVAARTSQCTLRKADVPGVGLCTQHDMAASGLCLVSCPRLYQDKEAYRFLSIKVRLGYQSLSQSFAPCRTEGSYSMADMLTSHCLRSLETAVPDGKQQIEVINDFYVTEVEFLTKQEAKTQWKQGDSGQKVAQPKSVPPLCEALQKVK